MDDDDDDNVVGSTEKRDRAMNPFCKTPLHSRPIQVRSFNLKFGGDAEVL